MNEPGALPEPEPRYQTASLPIEKTEHGHAWARVLAGTLLAIVLIVLIVLLARWIYHKTHNHSTPQAPTSQNTPAASSNNTPTAPSTSNSSSGNAAPSNSGSNPATPSQITNTGPGDVLAIFVGASLAAASLHYIVSIRRLAKDSEY